MLVVHIAFECAPIYKTGGLGDVVGSLPIALSKLGVEVAVVIPGYGFIKRKKYLPGTQIPVFYAESQWFTKPNTRHDPKIQAVKYAHFAIASLDTLKRLDVRPDILHCHDWHAGLIPWLLKAQPDAFFARTKTILTIHNIAYQGNFPLAFLKRAETQNIYELLAKQHKRISFLKEGIRAADFISTVSPHHATEIRRGKVGFGLSQVVRGKRGKFVGIINGIDYRVWNPRTDRLIRRRFGRTTLTAGKSENKTFLQKQLGLTVSPEIPLFGFVARLSSQKGIDVLLPLLQNVPKRRIQIVILGAGEAKYTQLLKRLQTPEFNKWVSLNFKFDEKLAHQIYAASDFFLIPSHYEPCGLTQMISMAYGAIPVATDVGGLHDTIISGKTGFLFRKITSPELLNTVRQALHVYIETGKLAKFRRLLLRQNFSWDKSAREYVRLYRKVAHL